MYVYVYVIICMSDILYIVSYMCNMYMYMYIDIVIIIYAPYSVNKTKN